MATRARIFPSPLLVAIALGLTVFAVYFNSLSAPFIFDDRHAIQDNVSIRRLIRLGEVLSPHVNQGQHTGGRPILNLSFALNYAMGRLSVTGYHAVNLTLHFCNGLLLFGVVRRTLSRKSLATRYGPRAAEIAFAVALLWLVHPLQTSAVTFIAQRGESLAATFYLLALYSFIQATEFNARPYPWLGLAVGACLVGAGVKETLVTAPVVIILYDRTFVSGSFREAWRARRSFYLALTTSWIVLFFLVANSGAARIGGNALERHGPWTDYVMTQIRGVLHYLRLGIWPDPLVFDYGTHLIHSFRDVWVEAGGLALLLGLTVYAIFWYPPVGFLGACFFIILAPTSSIVPLYAQPWAEHRMYLPLAAEIILLILACDRFCHAFPRWLLLAASACLLGGLTLLRNQDYRSPTALFLDTLEKQPANARAHTGLGTAWLEAGNPAAAVGEFNAALALEPNDARNHAVLARTLLLLGQNKAAVEHAARAVTLAPGNGPVRYTFGQVLRRNGDLPQAIAQCKISVQLVPGDPIAHAELGTSLLQSGQLSEAVTQYEKALEIDPDLDEVHSNLGTALFELNRFEDAIVQFTRALHISSRDADAEYLLGAAQLKIGKNEEAAKHFRAALKINPTHVDARNQLDRLRRPIP